MGGATVVPQKLPFSHIYQKHLHPIFPTIRRRQYGKQGEEVEVKIKSVNWSVSAHVLAKVDREWQSLPDHFLAYDTDTEAEEEALESINTFYRNRVTSDEELNLYLLVWSNPEHTIRKLATMKGDKDV